MKELGLHISIHDYFNFFISIFFQIVNIFLSTDNMYFLLITLLLPMIKAIVIVKIHQSTIYKPENPYAFLRNISLLKDASIQSCHSQCFHESNCRTAVYFNDKKSCSLFAEWCKPNGIIQTSRNNRASVICYRASQSEIFFLLAITLKNRGIYMFEYQKE